MNKDTLESTNKLLMVMISLMLRQKVDQGPTLRQQIEVLSDLGVKPAEIAEILGRNGTYINKELSGIRKSRKQ